MPSDVAQLSGLVLNYGAYVGRHSKLHDPVCNMDKLDSYLNLHCREERKIRCFERDLNSHLRVSGPPLYHSKLDKTRYQSQLAR